MDMQDGRAQGSVGASHGSAMKSWQGSGIQSRSPRQSSDILARLRGPCAQPVAGLKDHGKAHESRGAAHGKAQGAEVQLMVRLKGDNWA